MPTKIKQEDGTEVEVLTPAEVDAKLKEKESEVVKIWELKVNDQKTALDQALKDKTDLEAKIAAGGGGQSENFKTLKAELDKKDADITALKKSVEDSEIARVTEFRDQVVKKMAGNDKELEKKILLHYTDTLKGVPAKTQEEISKKLESAYRLSVDVVNPSVLNAAINGSHGPGLPPNQGGPVEFTAAEKSLGAKLGITEDDYKKYGPKLKTKR